MQAKMIRIGNSQGIVFPSALIRQYDLKGALEITPTPDGILISPLKEPAPREGWEEKIKEITQQYGSEQPDADWMNLSNSFDEKDWQW